MIGFWVLALMLLVGACLLLLWPILKERKHQVEADRTALNVALYQERVTELETQLAAGLIDQSLFAEGCLEAERDLLDDTEQGVPTQTARLGIVLPLVAAALIPIMGTGLYMYWGSSDKVALTLSLAQEPDTIEELIERLEKVVDLQPDSVDAWFFLGRNYMNQGRAKDAAQAFERAMQFAGRQPEILAQWVQAQYFAGDKQWQPAYQEAVDAVLAARPNDATMLGFVGIAAFESGRFEVAKAAWNRLLAQMDPRDPSAQAVLTGIERAEQALASMPPQTALATLGPVLPALPESTDTLSTRGRIYLQVELAAAVQQQAQPDDVVFVFARSTQAGQVPLAAQRLRVADLPAEVILSDADAVLPDLQLSTASNIQVQASIARGGNASQPDWLSAEQAVVPDSEAVLTLLIDQPAATELSE